MTRREAVAAREQLLQLLRERLHLFGEHPAVLGRRRGYFADDGGERAPVLDIVAMRRGQVPLEHDLGAVGLVLRLEPDEEALAQPRGGETQNVVDQGLLGTEVRVEAADREPRAAHHVGHAGARDAPGSQEARGGRQDRLVGALFLLGLGAHGSSPSFQTWATPPSTKCSIPVMKLASSDARKATALAMSSGRPTRPSGTRSREAAASPALSVPASPCNPGVSTGPGLTTLTRMWRSFRSVVHVRAKERMAAFVALYTL